MGRQSDRRSVRAVFFNKIPLCKKSPIYSALVGNGLSTSEEQIDFEREFDRKAAAVRSNYGATL